MYYDRLTKTQKNFFIKQLNDDGKSICFGSECKGKIKSVKYFTKNIKKCNYCINKTVTIKINRNFKYVCKNNILQKKLNREIMKEWNEISKMSKKMIYKP